MLAHREDIDLERELHRTYKMFLEGQAALLSHKGEPQSVYYNHVHPHRG